MGSQAISVNHIIDGESENSRHCQNVCDGTTVKPSCGEETGGVASDNTNMNPHLDNADVSYYRFLHATAFNLP